MSVEHITDEAVTSHTVFAPEILELKLGLAEISALCALNDLRAERWFVCATGIDDLTIEKLIQLRLARGTSEMSQITPAGRLALIEIENMEESEFEQLELG